jgi:type VI secretion system secreted protein Hcp
MASLQDIFIKLDGIDGESKDAKHKGWIDVVSFGYGVSQSSTVGVGGGSGTGKASFDTLTFTHKVDKTSPNLFTYCALGKHIPKVTLSVCKSGGGQQEYVNIVLEKAFVTHVSPSGSNAGDSLIESVGLSYAKVEIKVKEQKEDGSMLAEVRGAWDVEKNQVA